VWKSTAQGKVLHFYLAGINNQNFLMRDGETGTWWQQITGKAIYGPMKGASLDLVPSDELTFGEWKSEVSDGKVLAPVPKYATKYESNWEPEVAKLPVVISFPGTELKSRDIVVGLELEGTSRAYPWDALLKQSPVMDRVHGTPLLIVVGPDGKSFRAFISRIDGKDAEFFLKGDIGAENGSASVPPAVAGSSGPYASDPAQKPEATSPKSWSLLDASTASEWNFQGCATSGAAKGKCLERVPALKDYWFDWRNYHPDTTIYKR
jgi:Protein of unknown function (DUF3179)